MRYSKNQIVTSTDPNDRDAVAILDGAASFPVKIVERGPVEFSEVAKAEVTLAVANQIYQTGDHRLAFAYAVRAATEIFGAVGSSPEIFEPYKHLFDALQEIESGRLDPALDPGKISNRRVESSAEWNARGCLAGALEAYMALGKKEQDAAEEIRRKFVIIPGKSTVERSRARNRLIDWRKQFRSRKPPFGQTYYDTAVELIEKSQPGATDIASADALSRISIVMLNMAERYRTRLADDARG